MYQVGGARQRGAIPARLGKLQASWRQVARSSKKAAQLKQLSGFTPSTDTPEGAAPEGAERASPDQYSPTARKSQARRANFPPRRGQGPSLRCGLTHLNEGRREALTEAGTMRSPAAGLGKNPAHIVGRNPVDNFRTVNRGGRTPGGARQRGGKRPTL